MTEPTPPDERYVTLAQLAAFMGLESGSEEATSDKLSEALDAALEWVEDRLGLAAGGLSTPTRSYRVYPSGAALVLPTTRLASIVSITDERGDAYPQDQAVDIDLAAGIITLRRAPRAGRGWVVQATKPGDSALVRQAVKIIASHLYDVHRGRSDGIRGAIYAGASDGSAGGGGSPGAGFAVPNRAAELLAPFLGYGVA